MISCTQFLRKFLIGFLYFTESTQTPRYNSHKIQIFCYCISLSYICMDLQPYSHDRFSKILRTFYASRNSLIILVFLQHKLKEKLPIFLINTLLLYISLLALTHEQNYGGTNTLASRGLEELFFHLCCVLCQFLVLAGKRFWFKYACTT